MLVRNKYIEGCDEKIRDRLYGYIENETAVYRAGKGIPENRNVYPCGEYSLIVQPTEQQIPFITERVKSLYHYLPDMRDTAEELRCMTREEALKNLYFMQDQYDTEEVYDFLMQGLKENTLHNVIDFQGVEEHDDIEADRHIFIADLYVKGVWTALTCVSSGIMTPSYCCVDYRYKEQKRERALRYFSECFRGKDKQALKSFMSCKMNTEME